MEMDKNTVILDVYEYNRLRDFEKEINAENAFTCYSRYDGRYVFITANEALQKLAKDNQGLRELNDELHKKLYNPEPVKKELTVEDLKKMKFLHLLKWNFKK